MAKTKTQPELRFAGFTEDWEEKKLSEIAEIVGGGTPSTSISEYWNGDIDWYSPTEIGESVYANGSAKKITQLGLENSSAKILPANKTILFTSRAGIGDMAILKKEGATNQGFQSLVLKKGFHTYFIYSSNGLIKKYALSKASGSTFLEISSKVLGNMDLMVPGYIEQQKIGNFFENLDKLITEHQQKHTKLKSLKQAMLDKMFPKQGQTVPEIRFKGFEGDWEERKIEDLGEVVTGSTPSTQDKSYYSKNGIPWVTPTDILTNVTFSSQRHLSRKGEEVARVVPKNTILVTCIASIGKNTLLGTKGSFNQQINGLIPNEDKYNPYFLYILSSFWSSKMKRSAASGTMQIVPKSEFSKLFTTTPCIEEQKMIGNYFKNLDELIDNHETQITKLQNIKKALLAKMFI